MGGSRYQCKMDNPKKDQKYRHKEKEVKTTDFDCFKVMEEKKLMNRKMKLRNTKKQQCQKLLLNTSPSPKQKSVSCPMAIVTVGYSNCGGCCCFNYQVIRAMGTGKNVPAQKATVQKSVTPRKLSRVRIFQLNKYLF